VGKGREMVSPCWFMEEMGKKELRIGGKDGKRTLNFLNTPEFFRVHLKNLLKKPHSGAGCLCTSVRVHSCENSRPYGGQLLIIHRARFTLTSSCTSSPAKGGMSKEGHLVLPKRFFNGS